MPRLSIRIDFDDGDGDTRAGGRMGPGKIALLEKVEACGSISAAGRAMGMSYRRAWELVADLNRLFEQPLVEARTGGRQGGGATLTAFGRDLVRRYRAIEREAADAAGEHLHVLDRARQKP